mgnify:CR=1 FL=1
MYARETLAALGGWRAIVGSVYGIRYVQRIRQAKGSENSVLPGVLLDVADEGLPQYEETQHNSLVYKENIIELRRFVENQPPAKRR